MDASGGRSGTIGELGIGWWERGLRMPACLLLSASAGWQLLPSFGDAGWLAGLGPLVKLHRWRELDAGGVIIHQSADLPAATGTGAGAEKQDQEHSGVEATFISSSERSYLRVLADLQRAKQRASVTAVYSIPIGSTPRTRMRGRHPISQSRYILAVHGIDHLENMSNGSQRQDCITSIGSS
ncbi:hypothetical protein B0T25DRAFT_230176 [Lasiosphaeria hispida]|uniref:Uncharacterized protein n=1 Tax=Lasiosphaeria hispida TaxID=260671 RepID=A0AAJ0HDY1_9PEZI|nr:hypothetical protein B0T25DRAFT_230176 [Lasiosphaeria hispida]